MRPVEDADGVGSTDRAETGNRRARSLMCEGIAALTALDKDTAASGFVETPDAGQKIVVCGHGAMIGRDMSVVSG